MRRWFLTILILATFVPCLLFAAEKLLISEIVVTPTAGEFVEIFNPNLDPVVLSDYYLTDATSVSGNTYYYQIVEGGGGGSGTYDWHARFPDDAWIQPGEYQTVALAGDSLFFATYGVMPTYELYEDGFAVPSDAPDMREATTGSINNLAGLTNGDEVVILYYWDGMSDLVGDVDYLIYDNAGAVPNEAVDKTGVSIDGPDAGTDSSTYLDDTAIASQVPAVSPGYGFSTHRIDYTEGAQVAIGGNGITGADETSEDLDNTFTDYSNPSPNVAYTEPTYTVDGTVTLEDTSDLLEGTVVTLGTWTDTTDTLGYYQLAEVDSGTYSLNFSRTGYENFDTLIVVTSDITVDVLLNILPSTNNDLNLTFEDASDIPNWSHWDETNVWTVEEWDSTGGVGGSGALRLSDGGWTFLAKRPINATIGTFYNLSVDVKVAASVVGHLYLIVQGIGAVDDSVEITTMTSYTTMTLSGTAVSDSGFIKIGGMGGGTPDSVWVDNLVYDDDAPPPPVFFYDDFEAYTAGTQLTVQNSVDWSTWSGPTGTPEDPYVSDTQAHSGSNSVNIVTNNDLVKPIPNYTEGVYSISFWLYVPSGTVAYFNTLQEFAGTASLWGMQVYFRAGGAGDMDANGALAATFRYAYNTWIYNEVIVDLDADSAEYHLNGNIIHGWKWSEGAFGGNNLNQLGGSNFYGGGPAGTFNFYFDDYTLAEIDSIPDPNSVGDDFNPEFPNTFALGQNYPNPFNPITNIEFQLPKRSDVKIVIYNVLGQVVRTIVDKSVEAGYHRVQWDGLTEFGIRAASGVYFYRMAAKDYVKAHKMIMLK